MEAQETWEYEDLMSTHLLFQRLPDTTVSRLNALSTTATRWKRVNDEFTAKSVYAQNDLQTAFFDMRCTKGGDVCTFLRDLHMKREDLVAMGVEVTEREYQHMVLWGIPEDLACFTASLLSAYCITNPTSTSTMDMEMLINHISEEVTRI